MICQVKEGVVKNVAKEKRAKKKKNSVIAEFTGRLAKKLFFFLASTYK